METLKFIITILPTIISLIQIIEDQLQVDGAGKEKLEFLRKVLESTMTINNDQWAVIQKIVGYTVSLFNATGLFKTAQTKGINP